MSEPLRADHLSTPAPERLSLRHPLRAEILERHRAAVESGRPTYRDPASGLSVLTAAFLAGRGYCCLSGCRHCPFIGAGNNPAAPHSEQ
jgi:hypothetical protein